MLYLSSLIIIVSWSMRQVENIPQCRKIIPDNIITCEKTFRQVSGKGRTSINDKKNEE